MLRRTMVTLAVAVLPTLATAQTGGTQGSTQGGTQGSTQGSSQGSTQGGTAQGTQGGQGSARAHRSGTAHGMRGSSMGMTRAQVRQLQQSLAEMDCYDGTVDGIVGPRTRSAIACARQQRSITGDDPNELLGAEPRLHRERHARLEHRHAWKRNA